MLKWNLFPEEAYHLGNRPKKKGQCLRTKEMKLAQKDINKWLNFNGNQILLRIYAVVVYVISYIKFPACRENTWVPLIANHGHKQQHRQKVV